MHLNDSNVLNNDAKLIEKFVTTKMFHGDCLIIIITTIQMKKTNLNAKLLITD